MRNAYLFAICGLAAGCVASVLMDSPKCNQTSSPSTTCSFFKNNYPDITLLPDDTGYTTENEVSWDAGGWLGPACILLPTNAYEMSYVVRNLAEIGTPFAIRGGGHMTIANAANINSSGILISSTNLNMLQLSHDHQTMSVGPGNTWGDVYIYLNATQTGKMVVGARDAVVGVPGFLLGGGVSFFGYEYGFASTNGNVRVFECVLSDGTIVEATTSNEHSDLHWALQGGGNSFCILTRVDLRTIDSPGIMMADPTYGSGAEIKDQWLDSILNYVTEGSSDPKAAIVPVASLGGPYTEPVYESVLFYNGNNSSPEVLNDFQGGLLRSNGTELMATTLAEYAQLQSPAFEKGGQSYGLQQRFHAVSIPATKEAMLIVHDTYFDAVASFQLANLTAFFTGLAYTTITTKFIEASNSGPGCPQGVEDIPLLWVEESIAWGDATDDAVIENFVQAVNANITAQLKSINAMAKYIYLNNADPDQPVFQGYPAKNLQRLKKIRARYDPAMIFTNLMPGGFKVEHA